MASTSNPNSHQQVEEFAPSTSTSGGVKMLRCDVFINHFKHPLGEAIYKELDALGLKVFLNSEELELEDEEVEAAINSAWLYIPIFSEAYAQSSRCLEELSCMHNRRKGTKIVPIFSRVRTDDVRYVKEGYAFDPNKVGHDSEKLQEWKKALYSVSHYIGVVVEGKEEEDKLLKTITEWVAKEGNKFQESASANTSTSIQRQGEEFAATTSSSGGSIMFVTKLHYDVFINHRGPDVKRTLATAIYKMLTDMGLKVFLDSEELTWGGHFPSVLEEVMTSTWLNIVIFSESYAQSKWCLRELSFICRRGTAIVPIFYHVKYYDVRFAEGVYAGAFELHEEKGRYIPEKLQEWKEALSTVSDIIGPAIHSQEDEDILLKNIADWVGKEGREVQEFALANTCSSIRPQVESSPSVFGSGGYPRHPTRDVRYDVHINHRGPDVKRTLATAIYIKLTDMGLKVFWDSTEFRLGDNIWSVIEKSIRSAKIHIAIFSENYAQSWWCLDELSLMVKTGTRIVPIFYYVQPEDVRYATGVYADAFACYEEKGRYARERVEEWKKALFIASYYSGYIVNSKEDKYRLLNSIGDVVAEHPAIENQQTTPLQDRNWGTEEIRL